MCSKCEQRDQKILSSPTEVGDQSFLYMASHWHKAKSILPRILHEYNFQSKGEMSAEPPLYQAEQPEQKQIYSSWMNVGANGTHNKNIPSPFYKSYLVIIEASNAEIIYGFL